MKFLKADGTIEDGTPLTDRQVRAIERFEDYLHEEVCGGSYHGKFGKKNCRLVANALIPKLDDSACGSILAAMFVPELPPEVVAEPELEPETPPTQPVAASITDDDIPL